MAPELTLNEEGQLVNGDGEVFTLEDEPVVVKGALSQKQADQAIQQRLARQKETIKQLEEQAQQTPALQKTLEELKAEKAELEDQAKSAQQRAHEEVATQIAQSNKKVDELSSALQQERTARVRDQVTNQILSSAGDQWINPGQDIVPRLLQVHRREPKTGADGKPVEGQFVDLFEVPVAKDDGEEATEALPVDKALEALAARPDFSHYRKANNNGGSGGNNYGAPGKIPNRKRSEMSLKDKTAFIGEHGFEAFTRLPE